MRSNYQRGTIYEASNTFFIRHFNGIENVFPHKLCDRDEIHYSINCPAVLVLHDEQIVAVRKVKPAPNPSSEAHHRLLGTHRGAGTILTELTGNPIAAQQALCHLDLSTTMRQYIKTKTLCVGGKDSDA